MQLDVDKTLLGNNEKRRSNVIKAFIVTIARS